MSITSFWFLVLVAVGVIVYYIIPYKVRWVGLLVLSLTFYLFAGTPLTILYLLVDTVIAYSATYFIEKIRIKNSSSKLPFVICITSIISIVMIWFVVKGTGLWLPLAVRIFPSAGEYATRIIAALGMGYFTLQILGYLIDCYWGSINPQNNPLKLFLFVIWFPQLITGPISRYSALTSLYEKNLFKYENICFGSQRVLWGFFKKLVLAERLAFLLNGISSDPANYFGFWSWILILLYPMQMYCDFSGCMDIVLGVSELFGIKLTENFNNPFFALTSREFWQRWHITLGTWAKDYVLFPIQRTSFMSKLGKNARKKYGKNAGNFIKNSVCMFFLWMVMGIWHGGYRYIVGVSLWYWLIMMIGNALETPVGKITKALEMKTESFGFKLFQRIRTYLIYAVGAVFFSQGTRRGLDLLSGAMKVITVKGYANPWIFFDHSFLNLGIEYLDINVILFGFALLVIVGILREKYSYARGWVATQPFIFRWLIWLSLFGVVLIMGRYGSDFDASEFIYQGF